MIGRTIGKYRVIEQLGRGGMGTVYKAVDETLGREVAIKVLNADIIEADAIERFRREALTLARLNHPRIAAIHELTRDGHDLLMVMELLTGETCERLIERAGAMPIPHAVKLCSQVLDALQYAHKAGVVHRDLKPANIIVTPSGDVKVMDFGIARVQGSEHLTTNGFMVGTPAYMPPEQVRGEEVDPRMDLYSITVVLYRMLTHRLPFQGDTAVAMIHSQLHNPPTPPRQFRADLPEWIEQVLTRGLAKAPADRFQSALEFRTALEAGLSGKMPARRPADLEETIGPMPTPLPTPPPTSTPRPTAAPATSPSGSAPRPAAAAPSVSAPRPPRTDAMPAPLYNAPTPAASKTVTLKTPHLATVAVLVGAVAIGALAIAFIATRRSTPETAAPLTTASTTTPAAPEATSASQPATPAAGATSETPAAASAPATPSTPAPAPTAAAAPATAPAAATPAPPSAGTTGSSAKPADTAAATVSGSPTPATPAPPARPAAASSAGAASAPEAGSRPPAGRRGSPAASETTTARGGTTASAAAVEAPPEVFDDVRLLIVEGDKGREVDAKLALTASRLEVRAGWDNSVLRSIAYPSVTAATYVRGRRPHGQTGPNIQAVPDVGGGSIFGGSRHWLTLQTAGEFLVVRLEDRNVVRALMQLEKKIEQPIKRER